MNYKQLSLIMIFWNLSNLLINLSLKFTSVSISTILSSTSTIFTLILSKSLGFETFNFIKIISTMLSFIGITLVSITDDVYDDQQPILPFKQRFPLIGNSFALLSALSFSIYLIFLKLFIPNHHNFNFSSFLGYIGFINLTCTWPFLVLLHYSKIERLELPNDFDSLFYILGNMLITFSSDYLYIKALLKTTPFIATISLSLSLPFSIIIDNLFGNPSLPIKALIGSFFILISFIAVGYTDDDHSNNLKIDENENTENENPN